MTINERAKEFAQENAKDNNPRLVAHSYYCGAVDQRNEDINKACEWILDNKNNYSNSSFVNSDFEWDKFISDFAKAMKGE